MELGDFKRKTHVDNQKTSSKKKSDCFSVWMENNARIFDARMLS